MARCDGALPPKGGYSAPHGPMLNGKHPHYEVTLYLEKGATRGYSGGWVAGREVYFVLRCVHPRMVCG